ncbi:thioredoxin-like 1-2, chloroplastic [Zingiber officinale]|uniref:Thioredoxin domain-containing protein n=1 Tax=Zingiber officinale TaxID=94328 RepID=A0A8J5FT32_ZINOF|nr:thioredoxin-like 1-2, chloroplastic [Zingiber officinale]KAG6485111.1 hypothetical protein ZIOFF_053640 [Zingiber officinale]
MAVEALGKGMCLSCNTRRDASLELRRCSSSAIELGRSWSRFLGRRLVVGSTRGKPLGSGNLGFISAQMSLSVRKSVKWWEKFLHPNMKVIDSAQDLVDTLSEAGDKLVIVDFFSPGCGGCRALHPKICQFAEMNPNVLFPQINHEQHKSMCYSLNVHVLPFFKFYRGAEGRLCSFSCTNATIKKFKDALAKHNADRCSLSPAKGLEESELMALAANGDLSFNYTPKAPVPVPNLHDASSEKTPANPMLPLHRNPWFFQDIEEKSLATAQG